MLREMKKNNHPILLVFLPVFSELASYVACYAPVANSLKTNKNPAQI